MAVSTNWRKSSHSDQSDCVEVALVGTGAALRDSKNADGPVLTLPDPTWRHFLTAVS